MNIFFRKYNELVKLEFVKKELIIAMTGILLFHLGVFALAKYTLLLCVIMFIPLAAGAVAVLFIIFFMPNLRNYISPIGMGLMFLVAINMCFMLLDKLISSNWIVCYFFYLGAVSVSYCIGYRKSYKKIVELVYETLPSRPRYWPFGLLIYPVTKSIMNIIGPVALVLSVLTVLFLIVPDCARHMILFRYYHEIKRLETSNTHLA